VNSLILAVAAAATPVADGTVVVLLVPVLALSSRVEPRADRRDGPVSADASIPCARIDTIRGLGQPSIGHETQS
jgi:hypothetical protein